MSDDETTESPGMAGMIRHHLDVTRTLQAHRHLLDQDGPLRDWYVDSGLERTLRE